MQTLSQYLQWRVMGAGMDLAAAETIGLGASFGVTEREPGHILNIKR